MLKADKYIKNIVVGLLLGMSLMPLSARANELSKLDIKKSNSSGSALNVTIFTDNPYDENVAVTKKTDNKYVILIPNISGGNTSNVDFSAIKDVVSDVNVKSVNDGVNGYTKVTLTTTKPVSISTSTRKSAPLTEEQKAYKNLIAQSRGYASQNNNSQPQQKPAAEPLKYAPVNSESVALSSTPAIATKPIPEKDLQLRPKSVIDKFKNIVENSANQSNAADIGLDNNKVINLPPIETSYKKENVKSNNKILQDLNKHVVVENKKTQENITENKNDTVATTTTEVAKPNPTQYIPETTPNKGLQQTMYYSIFILLGAIFVLFTLTKTIKKQLEHSIALRTSFKENLSEQPHTSVIDNSDIISDSKLSWQEKYHSYINRIEEIDPNSGAIRKVGEGEYEFVASAGDESDTIDNIFHKGYASETENPYAKKSNLKPAQKPMLTSYNKPAMNAAPKAKPIRKVKNQNLKPSEAPRLEIVERKSEASKELDFQQLVSKLEKTLNNSPSEEKNNSNSYTNVIEKQFENNLTKNNNFTVPVHNEEDVIVKTLRTSPKLKSFAHKAALEKTGRRVSLPKQSSEIIKTRNFESKYVNLENSDLYSSARKFKDGNLSAADLISRSAMGKKIIKQSIPETNPADTKNDYSMATIDEFFETKEPSNTNYATAPASLSSRVAESLGRMGKGKSSTNSDMPYSGNPFGNKVVRSGYNIDNNSGFFIVSDENGNSSLVGKVNNTVTLLKEFNAPVRYRLQVRKDSPNVYMVRVGAERYLVEITGDKMGVLIEL